MNVINANRRRYPLYPNGILGVSNRDYMYEVIKHMKAIRMTQ